MSEMIERVARAIDPHAFGTFDKGGRASRRATLARRQARAAIESMSLPTQAMINAAELESEIVSLDAVDAEEVWCLMVAAALKGDGQG